MLGKSAVDDFLDIAGQLCCTANFLQHLMHVFTTPRLVTSPKIEGRGQPGRDLWVFRICRQQLFGDQLISTAVRLVEA